MQKGTDMKKIVLIGAGSAMFTQGLVADLVLSGKSWELGLVDIDPLALQVAERLARRMVELRDVEITVEASTDRCDLLPGSDVVVTTIGVGGRRAWLADVQIPRKYGVFQPVGDTAMAGGISRAMRMIPAMVDIAYDVVRLCPEARFFNYANPMTVVCWAVRKVTAADIIGLCIGVPHVIDNLADFIGKPRDEVSGFAAGVNHFTWIYDLRWNGADAWPLVRAQLDREHGGDTPQADEPDAPRGDTTISHQQRRPSVADNPFSWSLFDTYGAYPAVHDRHVVEFFPERFPDGDYYGKGKLGVDAFSVEATIDRGDQVYERMRAVALGEAPLDEGVFDRTSGEHSQLVEILDSIDGDRRRNYAANLQNRGAVPTLPAEAVVEVTATATARGLRAVQVPDFPPTLAAPLVRKIAAQEITVQAALSGRRKLFVEALLLDGSVTDPCVAERLADELLTAHAHHLPQFA
jgi:alpha-galactosidase